MVQALTYRELVSKEYPTLTNLSLFAVPVQLGAKSQNPKRATLALLTTLSILKYVEV